MRPYNKPIVILVTLIVVVLGIGVAMFSYRHQDTTVAPKIKGEHEHTVFVGWVARVIPNTFRAPNIALGEIHVAKPTL